MIPRTTEFVTSERCNPVTKVSENTIPSSSTIFLDLDDVIKRNSYRYLCEVSSSNENKFKTINGFDKISDIIIQACATQMQTRNDAEILKSKLSNDDFSSEILLREEDYQEWDEKINDHKSEKGQLKRWSYAKYNAEYTYPKLEENQCKHRRYLGVAEKKNSKSKKVPNVPTHINQTETKESISDINKPQMSNRKGKQDETINKTSGSYKKSHRLQCPNCKENMKVVISISPIHDKDIMKYNISSLENSRKNPKTSSYKYKTMVSNSHRSFNVDTCAYSLPCKFLPIEVHQNLYQDKKQKGFNKTSVHKNTPRVDKCVSICQHESLTNVMDQKNNMVTHSRNEYNPQTFIQHPRVSFSPCYLLPQYMIINANSQSNSSIVHPTEKEVSSEESCIFIRDVGCQFKHKSFSTNDSPFLLKNNNNLSSTLVEPIAMKNYFTTLHTLCYKDKFTSPISTEKNACSGVATNSSETYSEYLSHCRKTGHRRLKPLNTNVFVPRSQYVTDYSMVGLNGCLKKKCSINRVKSRDCHTSISVKSRYNLMNKKYSHTFAAKRKKRSRKIHNFKVIS